MPSPTRVLLWTDSPAPYVDAIAAAGLTERVAVEPLARTDTPTQAQRADTEAMLAWERRLACCRTCRSCAGCRH